MLRLERRLERSLSQRQEQQERTKRPEAHHRHLERRNGLHQELARRILGGKDQDRDQRKENAAPHIVPPGARRQIAHRQNLKSEPGPRSRDPAEVSATSSSWRS